MRIGGLLAHRVGRDAPDVALGAVREDPACAKALIAL
jgi:hypothetical protein